MRFKFIDAERPNYPLAVLCRVMQVSRGGYYAWRNRKPSARRQRDVELLDKIKAHHKASGKSYGSPRIYDDLRSDREQVSEKRVVDAPRPNVAWSSDITQLATPEGWLYMAVVLDLFARVVVGWALRNDITRQLVLEAVGMAIAARRPSPGLIFHSDRGSQYAAKDTEKLLQAHGVRPSMSGVGNCYDKRTGQTKALFGQVPQYRSGRRGLTALWTAGQASEGGDLRYMFCSRRRARGQTGAMALSVAREDAGRRRQ
jgi:putative transposase